MVKSGRISPGGYGARIRDRIFNHSLYRLRHVGGRVLRSPNSGVRRQIENRRRESTETRILLRITVYCLKILVRWLHQ